VDELMKPDIVTDKFSSMRFRDDYQLMFELYRIVI